METLILVNPKAREGRAKVWSKLESQVCDALGERSAQVAYTTAEDHGSGIVGKAIHAGVKNVVVVGGDGTLSEAIQGFFEGQNVINPNVTLMVLPGGRGDDFFKAISNQRFYRSEAAWQKGLDLIANGEPAPVDVGRFRWIGSKGEPRYFINIASFGFPGLVVTRVQAQRGLINKSLIGKSALTYGIHGATALKDYQPLPVQVTVDGQEFFEGPIHSGFILNGPYNAGGMSWDSGVRFDDGVFNVVVMKPQSFLTTLMNTSKILVESHHSVVGAHRAQGKRIRVTLEPNVVKPHPLFEIDGDLFEETETRGAEFELIPGAIRFQMLNKCK